MPTKMNFIVSHNDFETFGKMVILGTTGAALETEMNFFFTFWGLFLLKKRFKPGVKKFPFPFKRMGSAVFRKMLKGFGYDNLWDMVKDGVEDGKIKLYPCSMTLDMFVKMKMMKPKDLWEFVEEPVGAASFLDMCEGADGVVHL